MKDPRVSGGCNIFFRSEVLQKRWRGRESVCEYKKYKELRQLEIINSKGSGVRRKSLLGLRVRIRLTAAFELQRICSEAGVELGRTKVDVCDR